MCSTHTEASAELLAVLAVLVATPAVERGAVGSGERLSRLLTAKARLDALILDETAALDAAGVCVDDGYPTAGAWLRGQSRLGRRDASALVHHARQLRALPATAQNLADGAISREHAVQIIKAKTSSGLDASEFAPYETVLLELARVATPDEVKAATRHLVDVEAPERDKQLLEALADRTFDVRAVGDLVKIDALVDKVTAEALVAGVEALSKRTPDDDRSWRVRRADAFSEIVMLGMESGKLPQQGRVRPHLALTMTLDQLTGIEGTGPLLRRFGRIPARAAQRLGCDAVLTRFITDPHGEVLDVGRTSRHTNAALNKAIALMYDACAYPQCATPVSGCDIHHVIWWSKGGSTDRANLIPLCKHHHLFVHERGYTITARADADGLPCTGPARWTFTSPRGTPIPDHRAVLERHLVRLLDVGGPSSTYADP